MFKNLKILWKRYLLGFHQKPLIFFSGMMQEQRAQLNGLCYIHGSDMLQHYLVSMNTERSAPMINISKLIHQKFNAQQLEDHIFKDHVVVVI